MFLIKKVVITKVLKSNLSFLGWKNYSWRTESTWANMTWKINQMRSLTKSMIQSRVVQGRSSSIKSSSSSTSGSRSGLTGWAAAGFIGSAPRKRLRNPEANIGLKNLNLWEWYLLTYYFRYFANFFTIILKNWRHWKFQTFLRSQF